MVKNTAVTVHTILGLGNLSRTDLILDEEGTPWFIDVNVIRHVHQCDDHLPDHRGRRLLLRGQAVQHPARTLLPEERRGEGPQLQGAAFVMLDVKTTARL